MKRLTGLDASFLYLETPSSHMHVAGLAVYDPATSPDPWSVDKLRSVYGARLHLAPPFRQRLVEVPLGIHHPLWIEDPDFDLDHHIRHIAVPPPGGPRELAELAAQLVAIQLDRRRPLWEMWVIEGLEDGHVAVLSKVHHAAIDGASGTDITVATLDTSPEIAVYEPEEPWTPDRVPSDAEMLSYALSSLARQPLRAARATRRTVEAAFGIRRRNRAAGAAPPAPFAAPRTSLNAPLSRDRSYAMCSLSLSDVKRVKNTFGVTVNDVVLTLCGGALRHYFAGRDEEVAGPLVAMVPISVRAPDQQGEMGNQVSSALASLATDVDDPVERLLAVSAGMRAVKEQHQLIGATTLQDWAEFAAPAVAARAARIYSRAGLAAHHRPLFNVTVSNVPGPPFPLYLAGGRMVANYPMGPIGDGSAVNMTVMSYLDHLDVGVLACPDLVDDVWRLTDGLAATLEELLARADETEAGTDPVAESEPLTPTGDA